MTKSWALHLGLSRQKCLKYQEYVRAFFRRIPSALPHDLSRYHRLRTLGLAIFLSIIVFALTACHPRPIDDLALADVAMRAASRAKADSMAPDTYRKAENFFLRAKKDYAEGYFDSCRKNADEARRLAEQAEYQALRKQNQIRGGNNDFTPSPSVEMPPPPEGY